MEEDDEVDRAIEGLLSAMKEANLNARAAVAKEIKEISNNVNNKPNVSASEARSWFVNLKDLLIKIGGEVAQWLKETADHITNIKVVLDKCVVM